MEDLGVMAGVREIRQLIAVEGEIKSIVRIESRFSRYTARAVRNFAVLPPARP